MLVTKLISNIINVIKDSIKQSESLIEASGQQPQASKIPVDDDVRLASLISGREKAIGDIYVDNDFGMAATPVKKTRKKRKSKS